jgi:putative oxidoreductase
LALIIGLWPRWTALVLIGFTAGTLWITYGQSVTGLIFRPRQNVDFFQSLAIIGGLLFYFASGPGGWSRTSLR